MAVVCVTVDVGSGRGGEDEGDSSLGAEWLLSCLRNDRK